MLRLVGAATTAAAAMAVTAAAQCLGLQLLPALLLALAASAWVARAWGRSFFAISVGNCMPPSARVSVWVFCVAEIVYRAMNRKRFAPQKHRRPLTGFEALLLASHEIFGDSIVVNVVTIEPPVAIGALREAAAELQRRHPVLRAVIDRGSWPSFDATNGCSTVEVCEFDCSLEEVVKLHLSKGFRGESPCWRLGLCGQDLVLTYFHSFLDGLSIMVMLEELLTLLQHRRGDGNHCLAEDTEDEPGFALVVRDSLPWHAPLLRSVSLADKAQSWHTTPSLPSIPGARGGRWQDVRPCWRRASLEPRVAAELLAACRANGTTMLGALGAAMISGVGSLMQNDRAMMSRTFVNTRSDGGIPPRSLGCYAGWVDSLWEVSSRSAPFWENARRYKGEVRELMAEGLHCYSAMHPGLVMPYAVIQGIARGINRMTKDPATNHAVCFGISNRGAFKMETPAHRITNVSFLRNQAGSAREFFQLNACSVNGRLCLSLTFYDLLCPDEVAEALLDRVTQALRCAAEPAVGR